MTPTFDCSYKPNPNMDPSLAGFLANVFVTALALLPITNPPGNAPVFLSLTAGLSNEEREGLARRVAINCLAMMVGAMLVGSYILEFFGISLPVVRVGGGMLVIATAWGLLRSDGDSSAEPAPKQPGNFAVRAFSPLSFPLTVGPGSIATAITIGAGLPTRGVLPTITAVAASVIGLALVALAIYLSYRFAAVLVRRLGATGTAVFLRLSAFILLCIGVQICWDGLAELLVPWKPR